MKIISIDENRFPKQLFNFLPTFETLQLDCLPPDWEELGLDTNYKVKIDYQTFQGEEQWEIDEAKYILVQKQALIAQLSVDLDDITAQTTVITNMQSVDRIDETTYNTRALELKTSLEDIYTQFDIDMGAL